MNNVFLSLIDLQGRIMAATRPVEVAFLAVDLVHTMIPYRQAVLWNGGGIAALSGAATVDSGTPYCLWLSQVFSALKDRTDPTPLTVADVPAPLAGQWADWLPAYAVLLPMGDEALITVTVH